ncbi:hypothetical protein D3C85_570010 [compost metagenome]
MAAGVGRGHAPFHVLFDDGVGIGAAHPERTHACAQRARGLLELGERGVDREAVALECDHRIRLRIVQRWRKHTVADRQNGLDETHDPGGGVEVPDI